MDFEHINRFEKFGFSGGVQISVLQVSCDTAAAEQGVYLVARESKKPVKFPEESTGGKFKRRNPSVPMSELERRWLSRPRVLYVGKAGGKRNRTNIQDRLRSFMQFGLGHPYARWGGRYIWQLSDAEQLMIYWKPTTWEEPREVEKKLLCDFIERFGRVLLPISRSDKDRLCNEQGGGEDRAI